MSAKKSDFSDLSEVDAVRLVANSAVVARDSGHKVTVAVAERYGQVGIFIWMPGYRMVDGEIVASLPLVAKPEPAPTGKGK